MGRPGHRVPRHRGLGRRALRTHRPNATRAFALGFPLKWSLALPAPAPSPRHVWWVLPAARPPPASTAVGTSQASPHPFAGADATKRHDGRLGLQNLSSHTVLEARGPRPRCPQLWSPPALAAFPLCPPGYFRCAFFLRVRIPSSHKDTGRVGSGLTLATAF